MESHDGGQDAPAALRKTERELEVVLANCNELHNRLLELLNAESAESEIKWIREIYACYNEISGRIESFTAKRKNVESAQKQNPIQLEKVKMPSFTGEIRDYPRFKTDFERQVMPTISIENAPYILHSCLSKEAANTVKSIDDDLDAMWKRLDEKYGDPAKVVDIIMNDIQNTRNIKDSENRRLIEFVNIIEDGYRDLKRLGLEKEITPDELCEHNRKEIAHGPEKGMVKISDLRRQHC